MSTMTPAAPVSVLDDRRAVIGATVAIAIGSIGPWATVSLLGTSVSKAGTSGDGTMTLIFVGIIAAAFFVSTSNARWGRTRGTVALVAAVLSLAIAVYDFFDVSGTDFASVGWGLYLTLLGSIAAVVLVYKQRGTLRPTPDAATPATASANVIPASPAPNTALPVPQSPAADSPGSKDGDVVSEHGDRVPPAGPSTSV